MPAISPAQKLSFGYRKVSAAAPKVSIADPKLNVERIIKILNKPEHKSDDFIVFPELSITGYTAADLFFQDILLDNATDALKNLCIYLENDLRLVVVGIPIRHENKLFNCAAVIHKGKVKGFVTKTYIPNYQEFYEKRWFSSGKEIKCHTSCVMGYDVPIGTDLLFDHCGVICGIEICEDLWVPCPPSCFMALNGASLILNLSATNELYGKHQYLKSLILSQSSKCRCAYAYASAGAGESSTDLVFAGNAIIDCNGEELSWSERFSTTTCEASAYIDFEKLDSDRRKYSSFSDYPENKSYIVIPCGDDSESPSRLELIKETISVDSQPFLPKDEKKMTLKCEEIIQIQSWGLKQRLEATGCKNVVVGISGGLDSTLALLIAVHTFKKLDIEVKNITGITMPGLATSSRTYSNALNMMKQLGVSIVEIIIKDAVEQHFKDIGHDPEIKNAVYENSQARERTQILMDMANKVNGMVLGTGDLSELALGWCTYNGDHMSMYNVNGGVPKTLVKYLVSWFAGVTKNDKLKNILADIVDTPISPELVPADNKDDIKQKTEELVGPYELHDFFLFHMLRNGFSPSKILFLACIAFKGKYRDATILKWLKTFYNRFFSQQFKRSCMPDGPKVGSVSLSPRGDWRMPSDASVQLWIKELESYGR